MSIPDLNPGEDMVAQFTGNMSTYIKEHVMLAAIGSVIAVAVLMALGNDHAWTGIVGAVAAIGVRGVYVASEQVGMTWTLTDRRVISPAGVTIALSDIEQVRTIFSAAQIVTRSGDKYMLKYQSDPKATATRIEGTKR